MHSGDAITEDQIESVGDFPVYGGNGIRGYASKYNHDGTFVLIGRQGALCGNVHVECGRFWASEHAVVVTPRSDYSPMWLGAVLEDMNLNQYSISAAQPGLSVERILELPIPVPPVREQTAIACFLDSADERIQRYIRAKQKLISLLEEQEHAITHQVVMGQIDAQTGQPYPAYQSSCVEWLGQVPAHWKVVQLRRVTLECCDGPFGTGLKSSHYVENGVRVVRLQNIGHGEFRNSDAAFISADHCASLGNHSVFAGDLLIAGLGDDNHPSGRACVAPENIEPAMVKADCFRFRIDQSRILPEFVATQLTATSTEASAALATGATRQRTNLVSTSARPISIPGLDEQACILDYIGTRVDKLRAAQRSARSAIRALGEYRKRLVSEIVTGKLDVRPAASLLPTAAADGGKEDLCELL